MKRGIIDLTPIKRKSLDDEAARIAGSMASLSGREQITEESARHALETLRAGFDHMSMILSDGEHLSKELAKANDKIAEMQQRLKKMNDTLGRGITGEAVSSGMDMLETTLLAWVFLTGLKPDKTLYQKEGIEITFSDQIMHDPHHEKCPVKRASVMPECLSRQGNKIAKHAANAFDMRKLEHDEYDGMLMDTQKNRDYVAGILKKAFPGSKIKGIGISCKNIGQTMSVRAMIPWQDIHEMRERAEDEWLDDHGTEMDLHEIKQTVKRLRALHGTMAEAVSSEQTEQPDRFMIGKAKEIADSVKGLPLGPKKCTLVPWDSKYGTIFPKGTNISRIKEYCKNYTDIDPDADFP